jgi:AraC-like DNA-binding protein
MDRNGHTEVIEVPYRVSAGSPPGAEVLSLVDLVARATGHGVDPYAPLRPAFHHLIAVRSGALHCSVDFSDHALARGNWLWVRRGQILQFRSDLTAAQGTVVLFQPGFLSAATVETARVDQPSQGRLLSPADEDEQVLQRVLELLESEYQRLADRPLEVHIEVVRHLLAVLLLRLAHLPAPREAAQAGTEAFRRFQQAVEDGFTRTHRVEHYARQLGYSVRTLTRATQTAVGCGAKHFIDDRVLLEAKRLLVHTDLSGAAVANRLGFPEATVFTKFFSRRAGETPAAFRTRARGI